MDQNTPKNWVESTAEIDPFFVLTPAKLAKVLEDNMSLEGLSPEQQLYARAVLLNVASEGVNVMHDEIRLGGTLAARHLSPAYSIARVGEYERQLYDLIDQGKVDDVRRIVAAQVLTATAHPNFSRSRALVEKCGELISELATVNHAGQQQLQNEGTLPAAQQKRIHELLHDIKPLITPRSKRTRYDELQETTISLIPTAMKAASEQLRIFKKRKSMLGDSDITDVKVEDYERQDGDKTVEGKRLSYNAKHREPEFSSVKQLEAVAELLPQYNSWFVDGDGKRTCHVYDSEVAVPAIKRATYSEYEKMLEHLPDRMDGLDVAEWRRRLKETNKVLSEVEDLAVARMNALNRMQAAFYARRENTIDLDLRREYNEAVDEAQHASVRYMEKLDEVTNVDGMTVKQLMQHDDASALKKQLGHALQEIYDHKMEADRPYRQSAEELYIKLTAYGNFAVHLQRRENAVQYREVLEFLVQNNHDMRRKLSAAMQVDEHEISGLLENDPNFFSQAVEVLGTSAADPKDPLGVRDDMFNSYKDVANKLEKTLKHPGNMDKVKNEGKLLMQPLQTREFLMLDALGQYNMARLYPEAFKGGSVIAEFAQPDIEVLERKNDAEIRSEVRRLARTDMLLQTTFARAMGASFMPVIPLHEDPSTMKYIHEAQDMLREGPLLDYMMQQLDATTPDKTKARAVRYIDENGNVQLLTAYQNLKNFGCTDDELLERGHNIEELKKTYVIMASYDMEACSDIDKRSSSMGSEEAKNSVREKTIEASKYAVAIGDNGYTMRYIGSGDAGKEWQERSAASTSAQADDPQAQQYVILKPKYLGQGGALARSTKSALDTQQATWQGEHLNNLVPKSIAHIAQNNMLGRLYMKEESALGLTPSPALYDLAVTRPGANTGNVLGLPNNRLSQNERDLIDATINARIASTRDDPRYNAFLSKYSEPALNYSNRPNAKGTTKETFNSTRAIGGAAKEWGIWANIIGTAEMFDVGTKGEGKGEITSASIIEIRRWQKKDFYIQHLLTAGALAANFVNLEEKWARGNIQYKENGKDITLTKDGATVSLEELHDAYMEGKQEYKDAKTGVTFDAGDLVMSHLTDQFHRLKKGLLAVYNDKKNLLDLFDKEHQPTVLAYKELHDNILKRLRETKPGPSEDKSKDRELLEGAYYVLFESGGGVFPVSTLTDKSRYTPTVGKSDGNAITVA